jgi:hypothetical protein
MGRGAGVLCVAPKVYRLFEITSDDVVPVWCVVSAGLSEGELCELCSVLLQAHKQSTRVTTYYTHIQASLSSHVQSFLDPFTRSPASPTDTNP